ncbi:MULTISPECIES: hypothetical protein [unclassified Paenibacillus]|uniref:hypothetical protein n=1 Tax=unclassified Paenibacillus TaxID=185978 RepID=UPI00020D6AB7|nr:MULTISPECIES: hypothetical protein [unclassified Paenibacillus]EGL14013.1 hypothetical protein HMPREF9413_2014 [Paenibacillus sp. HGF7]EPD90136.1 hypothetical protein HMPREF1207_01405 [Paenibacillus sp. HGH0039]
MYKYYQKVEIDPHTHALPLQAGDQEVFLCPLYLYGITPGSRILFKVSIAWSNPVTYDIGELEINIRRDHPGGPVVESSEDSRFRGGTAKMEGEDEGGAAEIAVYYLTVRSPGGKALIEGPIVFEGFVLEEN